MFGYGGFGSGYEGHFLSWGSLVMGILLLALLVVAIMALIRLSKAADRKSGGKAAPELGAAFAILSERFARGEIDADTYRSMKGELEKT
jgi:putative membrane protein